MITKAFIGLAFLALLCGNSWAEDACFGDSACTATWGVETDYIDAMRHYCSVGGTSTKIGILAGGGGGSGTLRMGIYSDATNPYPGTLLWEGTDQSYVGETWIEETATSLTLESGTYYWLAFKVSGTQDLCYSIGAAASHHYRSLEVGSYATAFPNPWGTSTYYNTSQFNMEMCVSVSATATKRLPIIKR